MTHDLEVRLIAKDAIMHALSVKLKICLLHNTRHRNMDRPREQLVALPLLAVRSQMREANH